MKPTNEKIKYGRRKWKIKNSNDFFLLKHFLLQWKLKFYDKWQDFVSHFIHNLLFPTISNVISWKSHTNPRHGKWNERENYKKICRETRENSNFMIVVKQRFSRDLFWLFLELWNSCQRQLLPSRSFIDFFALFQEKIRGMEESFSFSIEDNVIFFFFYFIFTSHFSLLCLMSPPTSNLFSLRLFHLVIHQLCRVFISPFSLCIH